MKVIHVLAHQEAVEFTLYIYVSHILPQYNWLELIWLNKYILSSVNIHAMLVPLYLKYISNVFTTAEPNQ